MRLLIGAKGTNTRYLIEVPHDPDECLWIMNEIIGRGATAAVCSAPPGLLYSAAVAGAA